MKRNNLLPIYLLASMVGTWAICACDADEVIENENNVETADCVPMTFTATAGDEDEESATRTSVSGTDVLWNVGDAISVFSGFESTNYQMTLTSGSGTTSGSFAGNCAKNTRYAAIYPYNEGNSFESSMNYTFFDVVWNGIEQTATKGSFDPKTPMVARNVNVSASATTVPLSFKNVLSFVKVTTEFTCKSIALKSKGNETLAGDGFKLTSPTSTFYGWIGNTSTTVTLKGKDGADIEPGTYYIAVAQTTLSQGFDLSFGGVGDKNMHLAKSTSKSVTMKRNNVLNLGSFKLSDFFTGVFYGSGTETSPYQITSYEDWVLFRNTLYLSEDRDSYLSKCYELTNDIDCTDKDPLNPINRFNGHFNGNNHTIRNYRTLSWSYLNGLFQTVCDAKIENLNAVFAGIEFGSREPHSKDVCSPFIYSAENAEINNCHVSGADGYSFTLSQCPGYIGGVVGEASSSTWIRNCTNSLNFDVYDDRIGESLTVCLGGIVGYVGSEDRAVKIDRCRNTGNLRAYGKQDFNVGGIVGMVKDFGANDVELYITNCVNTGNIIAGSTDVQSAFGDDSDAGGIVGKLDSDGEEVVPHIYNCLNKGKIEAYQTDKGWAGGIVGWVYCPSSYQHAHLFNCFNCGQTVAKSGAYAFVGNTGNDYNLQYAKSCWNDYYAPGEIHGPSTTAATMNENTGSAHLHAVTNNDSKWVSYTWGCCQWIGASSTLDIDFTTSVE